MREDSEGARDWHVESMRFRFQLGENQLFARAYDVAVYGKRFLDITGDAEDVRLPISTFRGKVAAYVVLSHPITKPLPIVTQLPDAIRYASHQYRRGFIRVEGTFDEYLARLTSNQRRNLKVGVKKFRERTGGTIHVDEFATSDRMDAFHALARQVSAKTYQEKLFKKGLPTTPEFLRDMHERTRVEGGVSAGRARGYILYDDKEKPIAYLYAFIDDGVLTYDFVGFDPDYVDWSPGKVLQYVILERLFAEKYCAIFDFGEGESQYKDQLSTDSVQCADMYFFPRDARGVALAASQAGLFYVSRGIVHVLDRFGLKQKIKRMLRGQGPGKSVPPPAPSTASVSGLEAAEPKRSSAKQKAHKPSGAGGAAS